MQKGGGGGGVPKLVYVYVPKLGHEQRLCRTSASARAPIIYREGEGRAWASSTHGQPTQQVSNCLSHHAAPELGVHSGQQRLPGSP